jgi:hypothetical protein
MFKKIVTDAGCVSLIGLLVSLICTFRNVPKISGMAEKSNTFWDRGVIRNILKDSRWRTTD